MELLTLAILLPLLTFVLFLYLSKSKPNNKIKSPDASSLYALIKNGHRIIDWTTDLLSESPSATVTTFMGVITADPATVEHITKARFDSYVKGDHSTSILKDFLGDGIFNSDGDLWKLQRRTASLEFSTKTIRTFVMANVHLEVLDRLIPLLSSAARSGMSFDLQEKLELFAFDNVCKVVFNEDLARLGEDSLESKVFNEAFEEASNICVQRFQTVVPLIWKVKRFLGVGSEKRLKERIKDVHDFATKVVKLRKEAMARKEAGDDLISRFIAEKDYSDEFLRDIITSFVLAGRDTTSATLTWFFWLVAQRPAVKERIMEEIKRVREKDPNKKARNVFTLDQVREMDYLHAVLSETLRLYPPVPLQGRTCSENDMLPDGTKVKKGTTVMYNSYAMGRSERIWGDDCNNFRPERWLDERGVFQPKNPYAYPVFHAGPRMCLGKDMAYIQMKVVAATVMERFEVEVVDMEKEREHELILIMKMKGELMVRIKERKE